MTSLFRRRQSSETAKLFVIGLDCAPPELLFDAWRSELPHLKNLIDNGVYGVLNSSVPPLTVPAWSCMTSGRDPGEIGCYGFRNRRDTSYHNRFIANGDHVPVDRVWDILGKAGKQSIVVGVPQTYPVKPIQGQLISSFLTPTTQNPRIEWTYPYSLRHEIDALLAPDAYDVDVPQFRTDDKAHLLQQIYAMTEKRFRVLRYLLQEKPWDFFMFVEMGVDRIHHGLWSHHDPGHPKHDPNSPFRDAIKQYYQYLDKEIGRLLPRLPPDTHVLVVSDHGVRAMQGGFCINEWLRRAGYLTLLEEPPTGWLSPFEKVEVDWSRTQAWAEGGYVGRIFLNVQGREPEGIVPPEAYEAVRDKLAAALCEMEGPNGRFLQNRIFKPDQIYRQCRNVPPDLLLYVDNLSWRTVSSFGHEDVFTTESDTGPDDANHDEAGLWIHHQLGHAVGGKRQTAPAQLMDIAPTILSIFGIPVPEEMQGERLPIKI